MLTKTHVRGLVVLFGSMLMFLTFGTGFTNGNMMPYMTSYLHVSGSNPNISASDLIWLSTLGNIGEGLFMNIGGIVSSYLGPQITSGIGCSIASASIASTYFSIQHSAVVLVSTYGFLEGIGKGIAYTAPITICMTLFPNNKALVSGLIVASLGFGGFIFSPVQTQYINPKNIVTNDHGYFLDLQLINRIPKLFLLMGGILISIQLLGYLFLLFGAKKKNEESSIDGVVQSASSSTEIVKVTSETSQPFTPKQILCHCQFYALWATFLLNLQIVTFTNTMFKVYGQTFIKDDKFLALVDAIASLFNAGGRILWGFLMDKSSYKLIGSPLTSILTQNLASKIGISGLFGVFGACSGIIDKIYNCQAGMFSKNSLRGIAVLCGSMLLHLTYGNMYTNGNVIPYITSYLREFGSNPNVTSSDLIWLQTLGVVGQGLFMNVGGILSTYFDPRIAICIGNILASGGIALSHFTINHSVGLVAVTYGFVYGLGMGLAYMPPITICMAWFPNNRALITGLIVGCLGFGGCIFSPLQTQFLNPNNIEPKHGYFVDQQLLNRLPKLFLLLAGISASMQLTGFLLLSFDNKRKTEEVNTDDAVQVTASSTEKMVTSTTEICQSFTPKQMLCHRRFYILWTTCLLNIQIISFINAMYKAYGETFIKDDQFLAMIGAVAGLFNASGRVLWGFLMDKFRYKVKTSVHVGFSGRMCSFISNYKFNSTWWENYVWVLGVGNFPFFSGNFTLLPASTAEEFGLQYAGINYGLVFTNTIIGTPLNAILTENLTSMIGWNGMFGLFAGCSGISFLITLLLF
uniref:Major facilitator superfamily (MFS) profile domain-containing protein n=1 Tax=Strigamia maritima TaxID=126957 RepID=T1J0H9_STRMM